MSLFNSEKGAKDELAREMLAKHMNDCVIARSEDRQDRATDKAALEKRLADQDKLTLEMHKENRVAREKDNKDANARFVKLLLLLVAGLLSPFAGRLFEMLKNFH